ncbi:hypothetical protein BS50DRAFT_356604 [Corynespora cassiicola Philippines]|uniref:Uncharacterized protein n=1 Tax=Corynespora cassiicola Philippines TaxID=1448308 RepID=A0A2T2NRJ8_CORCC|nr:hypothetical protein BS50DRAFT_356604 [Corynespora cassiicola Philippines]
MRNCFYFLRVFFFRQPALQLVFAWISIYSLIFHVRFRLFHELHCRLTHDPAITTHPGSAMHFPHSTPEMSSTEITIVHDPPIVSQARNVCIHHCSSYSQNLHATPFNEHASPIPYPPLFGAKLPSRSHANDGELACLSFLTGRPTA